MVATRYGLLRATKFLWSATQSTVPYPNFSAGLLAKVVFSFGLQYFMVQTVVSTLWSQLSSEPLLEIPEKRKPFRWVGFPVQSK